MSRVTIANPHRTGGQYTADLLLEGEIIGRVERNLTTGFYRDLYSARVKGIAVAMGHTLADLRAELRDPEIVTDIEGIVSVADTSDLEDLEES